MSISRQHHAPTDEHLELRTSRTVIRLLREDEAALLQRYRLDNREHFAPWEPLRDPDYYGIEACRRHIEDTLEATHSQRGYPMCVLDADQRRMLASFTLANPVRGVFQACHLGYGVAADCQGQGLMSEALRAGIAFAFGPLRFHRIMANYMPANDRSGRLLQRLGFQREGYARDYMFIAGRWEDHVLTALVAPQAGTDAR